MVQGTNFTEDDYRNGYCSDGFAKIPGVGDDTKCFKLVEESVGNFAMAQCFCDYWQVKMCHKLT